MGGGGPAEALAVYPDGSLVTTGHTNGWALAWDTCSGGERGRALLHAGAITALAFLPDGSLMLSAGEDHVLRAWSLKAVQPGRDRPFVFVMGDDPREHGALQTVKFDRYWETRLDERALSLAVDGDGMLAAAGMEGRITLIQASGGGSSVSEIETIADHWSHVQFSPDGSLLLGASEEGRCSVWEVARHSLLASYHMRSAALGCAWAPDGQSVAVTARDGALLTFVVEGRSAGAPVVPAAAKPREGAWQVICPQRGCGASASIPAGQTGRTMMCPNCGRPLRVGRPVLALARFEAEEAGA
jgi:WD40 repeat protein